MTDSLIIKRPKIASPLAQFAVAVFLVVGPLLGLSYFWSKHRDIHFDNPEFNLLAHTLLIAVPLAWVWLIAYKPIEFEEMEEICVSTSGFFSKFPVNWWMMLLTLAAPVFALFILGYDLTTRYLPNPENLTTSPAKALGVMAVTFVLGFFCVVLLSGSSEPRTLVSQTGLRTGMVRLHRWDEIDHMSRYGDLYVIYHRANPALPATCFQPKDQEAQVILERFLSECGVKTVNDRHPQYMVVRVGVILGFIFNLCLSMWLRLSTPISVLWIITISFGVGIVLTILLERIRKVAQYGKYNPVIEPEPEGEDSE